jgi:micrococcal nuclease
MNDLINYSLPEFSFIEKFLYHYRVKVLSVYDGDTIRVQIDFGFGMTWSGNDGKGVIIRLHGIDTPELRGEEKNDGLISRNRLREEILGKTVTLKTVKDKTGKYGRYLGIIIKEDGTSIKFGQFTFNPIKVFLQYLFDYISH